MMTIGGKFIVLDGTDGSGKKTQAKLLLKRLADEGYKAGYYDFPQYGKTLFGDMTARYLNGEFGEADDVSPYFSSLLYAGDRWQAKDKIAEDIKNGKIIISNRYTSSSMAFQTAKIKIKSLKKEYIKWIEKLEFETYKIPRPDLVLFLYVPFKISRTLVDKKDKRNYTDLKRDIHEKNDDFMQRAENEYLFLAKNHPDWKIINCCDENKILPVEIIHQKIWKAIAA